MAPATHLEIIPLGGLGEFGMNLMLYRYGDDCIAVDTGMMFPGAEHLGVDVVIPDLSFLDECGTLHAVTLTHGHEDHVGALPFALARRDVPVYGTPFTLGLARRRLSEHGMKNAATLRGLPDNGDPLELGPFTLEILPVSHSIPHAVMFAIHTPLGTVVHTADFKLDPGPLDGVGTDLGKISRLGEQGVLALLSDSTNAERPGTTPGERTVTPHLDALFKRAERRIFVTTFASNVERLQQVIDLAVAHGRKVALVGSSMIAHAEVAERLGLLRIPAGTRVPPDVAMNLPPSSALFLVTGSQGEPMSALVRIAVDRHKEVALEEGDLVVHSARSIPGNEKSVDRMINHVLRRGAEVVTESDAPIHVSGHPSRDELRCLLKLIRPGFFLPIHGEYRQLLAHARLAADSGLESRRIVLAETGDMVALSERDCEVVDRVQVGRVFIDASLEEVDLSMLRDRRKIAGDGIVVPVIAVERRRENARTTVEIVSRGFVPEDDEVGILDEVRDTAARVLEDASDEERADEALLKAKLQTELKRFLRRRAQRRPLIIPVIVEL